MLRYEAESVADLMNANDAKPNPAAPNPAPASRVSGLTGAGSLGQNAGRSSMRPSWTIGRGIAVTLSLLLLGFGVKCFFDGHRLGQAFERWRTAKPVDGAIELSAPGRFVLPFDQTCSSSHGETVALRVPAEVLQGTTVTQLLAGLAARLDITDKSGSNVVESAGSEIIWGEEKLDGAIPLFSLAPFRKGAYKATVTVIEGAPALKGIPQRVEGRYLLCGLERMPATIAEVIGIGSVGIGSIVGLVVAFRVAKDQKGPHPVPGGAPNNRPP